MEEIDLAVQVKRAADALEKLANEQPMMEIEPAPPQCPHCEAIWPSIIIDDEFDGSEPHPISEFALIAICANCNKQIIGIVNHWVLHPDKQKAIENINYIKSRMGHIIAF